jgi:hypothetical protein
MTSEHIFRALDIYEGVEVIGYGNTREQLDIHFRDRDNDTDGECYLIAQKYDSKINKWVDVD